MRGGKVAGVASSRSSSSIAGCRHCRCRGRSRGRREAAVLGGTNGRKGVCGGFCIHPHFLRCEYHSLVFNQYNSRPIPFLSRAPNLPQTRLVAMQNPGGYYYSPQQPQHTPYPSNNQQQQLPLPPPHAYDPHSAQSFYPTPAAGPAPLSQEAPLQLQPSQQLTPDVPVGDFDEDDEEGGTPEAGTKKKVRPASLERHRGRYADP